MFRCSNFFFIRSAFWNYYPSHASVVLFSTSGLVSTPLLFSVRPKSSYRTTKSTFSNNIVVRARGSSFHLCFNFSNFHNIYSWSFLRLKTFVCNYFDIYFRSLNKEPRLTPGDLFIGHCVFFRKFRGGYLIDLLFFCSSSIDISRFSFCWLSLPPCGDFLGHYKPRVTIIDTLKYQSIDKFYSYFFYRRHYIYVKLFGLYPLLIDRELQKKSKSTTAPRKFLPLP